jgi:hypothetical protein
VCDHSPEPNDLDRIAAVVRGIRHELDDLKSQAAEALMQAGSAIEEQGRIISSQKAEILCLRRCASHLVDGMKIVKDCFIDGESPDEAGP